MPLDEGVDGMKITGEACPPRPAPRSRGRHHPLFPRQEEGPSGRSIYPCGLAESSTSCSAIRRWGWGRSLSRVFCFRLNPAQLSSALPDDMPLYIGNWRTTHETLVVG